MTSVALPVLRPRVEVPPALFELRAGMPIASGCALVLVFLLFQSSWRELVTLTAVAAAAWCRRAGRPSATTSRARGGRTPRSRPR